MCTYMHIGVHICVYARIYAYVGAYMHIRSPAHMRTCGHVRIHAGIYVAGFPYPMVMVCVGFIRFSMVSPPASPSVGGWGVSPLSLWVGGVGRRGNLESKFGPGGPNFDSKFPAPHT